MKNLKIALMFSVLLCATISSAQETTISKKSVPPKQPSDTYELVVDTWGNEIEDAALFRGFVYIQTKDRYSEKTMQALQVEAGTSETGRGGKGAQIIGGDALGNKAAGMGLEVFGGDRIYDGGGVGIRSVGGMPDGDAINAEATGTGTGVKASSFDGPAVRAMAISGPGLRASSYSNCGIVTSGNRLRSPLRLMPRATPPEAPKNGEIYYDSKLRKFRGRAGNRWVDLN